MAWTDERIETLRKMWEGGQTASQIAEQLGGVSR
ncbi:MAG: GcrA cell cycle regulator, partial [Bradyrhizobium sp.]|nr:GcrA cell cycle regulator [Bradyrhizobium sp.]